MVTVSTHPGFEYTPMTLRKIASFITRARDGRFAAFAFAYSMLAPLDGEEVQEDTLLARAIQVIHRFIDEDKIERIAGGHLIPP